MASRLVMISEFMLASELKFLYGINLPLFLQKKSRKISFPVIGFRKMSNRFNLFALFLCTLILALAFWTCREPVEAEEPPPGPSVKGLALDKRQRHPSEEPEAQIAPWANKIENCTVTYYDCCVKCCGNAEGITYSGAQAVPYETCAVDPKVIPLGSAVMMDYGDGILHQYRAEDIGGGVKGNHIDVCVADHEEALALGTRTATVYWMEMEALG